MRHGVYPSLICAVSTENRGAGSKMSDRGQGEKRYDPRDTTLKFVNRPDDLDPLRKHQKLIKKRL